MVSDDGSSVLHPSRRDCLAASPAAAAGAPFLQINPQQQMGNPVPDAMNPDDPRSLSLVDLAAAIRDGRITSETAIRAYLDRIDAVNPQLNAVVQLRRDAAIEEARTADRVPRARRGLLARGPLHI